METFIEFLQMLYTSDMVWITYPLGEQPLFSHVQIHLVDWPHISVHDRFDTRR